MAKRNLILDGGRLKAALVEENYIEAKAYENVALGSFVNIFMDGSEIKIRLAKCTDKTYAANGFIKDGGVVGDTLKVYHTGINDSLFGLTVGSPYYLGSTPGSLSTTAPSTNNHIYQFLGYAISSTKLEVAMSDWIELID